MSSSFNTDVWDEVVYADDDTEHTVIKSGLGFYQPYCSQHGIGGMLSGTTSLAIDDRNSHIAACHSSD